MTRRIRKHAPEGATHFAFLSGELKYIKIEKSGCHFIYAGEWIPSVLLDERFNLHALKPVINPVFYAMIAMTLVACFVAWLMLWGAK